MGSGMFSTRFGLTDRRLVQRRVAQSPGPEGLGVAVVSADCTVLEGGLLQDLPELSRVHSDR